MLAWVVSDATMGWSAKVAAGPFLCHNIKNLMPSKPGISTHPHIRLTSSQENLKHIQSKLCLTLIRILWTVDKKNAQNIYLNVSYERLTTTSRGVVSSPFRLRPQIVIKHTNFRKRIGAYEILTPIQF